MSEKKRLLIEDWLPAAAIGVECMREEGSISAKPPHKYLHVWWARRPLTASRAAILASLLPATFPHDVFERLLGFGKTAEELVAIRDLMDTGLRIPGGFNCDRAFKAELREDDLAQMHQALLEVWGTAPKIIDPMAGGGSIPLEAARLGLQTYANELNPVACTVLDATLKYPFQFGASLATASRKWGGILEQKIADRLNAYYPKYEGAKVHAYIFARTIPDPNIDGMPLTPLVPDWHLLTSKGAEVVANPIIDAVSKTWRIEVRTVGTLAGDLRKSPPPTYKGGTGYSIFSAPTNDRGEVIAQGRPIDGEWIKSSAQAGAMGSILYAVAIKSTAGLQFRQPTTQDIEALDRASADLETFKPAWERRGILPTEQVPVGHKTGTGEGKGTDVPLSRGEKFFTDMFAPRQLLTMGVIVEELQNLCSEIYAGEEAEFADAITTLLSIAVDKYVNYNCTQTRWHPGHGVVAGKMDRHDYAFKATFAELAPIGAGDGFRWALDNTLKAYGELAAFCVRKETPRIEISLGSASSLVSFEDHTFEAVVVDPPYDDNVQYSELADFFYVWLKRIQAHRRPEWFSSYLCDHDQEAVVNHVRHLGQSKNVKAAKADARIFYRRLMTESFTEAKRILRDDGVLTVMFTHKKQDAWSALFSALIAAGFSINATWPIKTESEHSLHQARKNAAQSTVFLVARKRTKGAGRGFYDANMKREIEVAARDAAQRHEIGGLNAVDQLVGSFGPAMEIFSHYDTVVTDTGDPVDVSAALEIASDAVMSWRIEKLAKAGLEGVEPEGRFALLFWDVLKAEEVRFNEVKLLGHAVGMDVDRLVAAGLVTKTGDKVKVLSASLRRRAEALTQEQVQTLFGIEIVEGKKGRKKADVLKVHPNDPMFRTALDSCHAAAIAFAEAGGGSSGIGVVRAMSRRLGWSKDGSVARLMEALVAATPLALQHSAKKGDAADKFPEFRAWREILKEVFSIEPPEWKPPKIELGNLFSPVAGEGEDELEVESEEEESEDEE